MTKAGRTIRFGMIRCVRSIAETVTSTAQKNAETTIWPVKPNVRTQAATSTAVAISTAG